jgi:SAM-dependent methyltransferase
MASGEQAGEPAETPLKTARQLLSDRRPLDALEIVDALLADNPDQQLAIMFRARILEWQGDFANARTFLKRAKKAGADSKSVAEELARVDKVEKQIERATALLAKGDPDKAHATLIAAKKERYNLAVELQLARASIESGKLAGAKQLIENVLAAAPGHKEALDMKFLIDSARKTKKAITKKTGKNPAPKAKKSKKLPAKKTARERAEEFLEKLPDRLKALEEALNDGDGKPETHVRWLRENADHLRVVNWANDVNQAKAAHFAFATSPASAIKNYYPAVIEKSVEFGYITWPRRIQDHIRGKSVLDVGCGFGAFGNGFLVAGAKKYTGIDPKMPLDVSRVKNKRKREWSDLGTTPNEIMERCPDIHLINGIIEDLETKATYDAVVLHNVTEHLHNIREIIPDIRGLLNPGGYLIYHHDNFFSWNGHHMAPSKPEQYEPGLAKHEEMVDWNHILIAPDVPENHIFNTSLNQIRLDEIKAVTEDNYVLEKWLEIESPQNVADRLTDDVFNRLREFDESLTRRDLMVSTVLCIAQTK